MMLDCTRNLIPNVETRIFDFKDGIYGLHFDAFPTPSWTWGYRRLSVLAETADVLNIYYNLVGEVVQRTSDYPSEEYDVTSSSSTANSFYGACGFGKATRDFKNLEPITSKGSAPISSEECEEVRDEM